METCNKECEVYSRIVGYYRPVKNWNIGKRQEFKDRLEYNQSKCEKELKCKECDECTIKPPKEKETG